MDARALNPFVASKMSLPLEHRIYDLKHDLSTDRGYTSCQLLYLELIAKYHGIKPINELM